MEIRNDAWRGFKGTHWTDDINVRDFIQNNYTVYEGDESFLAGPTEGTDKLWGRLQELQKEERARGGVLECETEVVTGLTAYGPGYIDNELKGYEKVVGLQTDKPLKRAFMPYGGIKMAMQAASTYGYEVNPKYKKIFKEMQFFGARANLAKCLLYAINGGFDEKHRMQCGPELVPITSEYLDYNEVIHKFDLMMDWLAGLYVNILNLIQYMHDKYYYEAAEMALIDTDVRRTFATGIAGFSHVVDSLSAIKYAKVKVIRDEEGIAVGFETEGDFPKYGNDDDRADEIAVWLLKTFITKIKKYHTYRDSEATTSILTITSNVVYGKATGATPDGREAYKPFAPGGNPSYGAEQEGLLASLNSVAKVPYEYALDGISNTQTISPTALGHNVDEQKNTLVNVMDGYFDRGAHHLNVNVFGTEKLIDAMNHPEKPEYANFTIRVSGYAVKFIDLTKEQQMDVIARTCHKSL